MKMSYEEKYRGRGRRICWRCGTSRGVIRSYGLRICRRCFRETARDLGFEKY